MIYNYLPSLSCLTIIYYFPLWILYSRHNKIRTYHILSCFCKPRTIWPLCPPLFSLTGILNYQVSFWLLLPLWSFSGISWEILHIPYLVLHLILYVFPIIIWFCIFCLFVYLPTNHTQDRVSYRLWLGPMCRVRVSVLVSNAVLSWGYTLNVCLFKRINYGKHKTETFCLEQAGNMESNVCL